MVTQNNQVTFDWNALFGSMCAFMLMLALVGFLKMLLERLESPKLLPQTELTGEQIMRLRKFLGLPPEVPLRERAYIKEVSPRQKGYID